MDKRRVRYGLMLPQERFIELLSIKQSRNGFILWTPKSRKHITIINEDIYLSSHKTDEFRDNREHIGRLKKEINLDDEEVVERLYRPRLLERHEYSKQVIFLHADFISYISGNTYDMKADDNLDRECHFILSVHDFPFFPVHMI